MIILPRWIYRVSLFALAGMISVACSQPPVSNHGCQFSKLTSADVANEGEGMLQVDGSTSVYYYVIDESGGQIAHQSLNQPVKLGEGRYRVRLNNALHEVEIRAGYLTKCHSGTLLVSGSTDELYHVTDSLGNPLANEKLGKSVSLFEGAFKIKINNTETPVAVRLNEMTEVRTGSLVADGTTSELYYVLDHNNKQLNFGKLATPLSFLPGTYRVNVNNTIMKADVFAGRITALVTGNLLVSGLTDELYYVTDTTGHALNFQKLNNAIALFPGVYNIQMNNTIMRGEVFSGQITAFDTGSLTLRGSGGGYYYVFDNAGKQLNYNSLNRWLSFFPSEYIVKLGGSTQKATVVAGQQTSLEALN